MRGLDKRFVIDDRALGGRILEENAEDLVGERKGFVVADCDLDAERLGARLHDLDRLRMAHFRDKKCVAPADDRMTKRHRFRRGGRFVEQRGIGDIERGQIGDHRLKIEQRFEAALRNLGLVRRVGRVPAGIFQNVALDDRRRDAIGVAGANEVTGHLVLLRDLAQFGQRFVFRFARGQVERIR